MYDRPLHLGLDARTVHAPARRGTGKNLVDLYASVLELRPEWTITGFHRGDDEHGIWPRQRTDFRTSQDIGGYRSRHIEMVGDRFDAWLRWRLPQAAWQEGVDLLHCPANLCPTWNPVPTLLTVHDLMPLDASPGEAARFSRSIEHAVQQRLTILTPSQFTRDALIDRFDADASQFIVNAWAPDRGMKRIDDIDHIEQVLSRYGVSAPFMLHLGAPQPRKNTQRVIAAFAALPENLRRACPLLIVGVDHPPFRRHLEQEASELGLGDTVKLYGFADERDMPALFSAADILIYPSLSEGFGLPILDAFVTGAAVLTSSRTSLPEVGGDAALYVDPTSVDEIRDAMQELIVNDARRRLLIERGFERVKQYTWDATAARFLSAIDAALEQKEGRRRAA